MRLRLTGLQPGQQYAVQVRANGGDAVSEWGRRYIFTALNDITIPATPQGFAFTNDETTSFYASWDAVTTNNDGSEMIDFDHYEVNFDNGTSSCNVNTTDNSYTLTLEENTNLFEVPQPALTAKVRTIDIYGNASLYSTPVLTVNQPPVPCPDEDGVHVYNAIGIPDAIRVIWQAPDEVEEDFSIYTVHTELDPGAPWVPSPENQVWAGHATSYVHQTTEYDTMYYFKVARHDVFGQQSSGNPVDSAKPKHASDSGDPPSGNAGGDLTGTYPDPQIALGVITAANVAVGNKDGAASTPSMRTLGTGANQAAAGNDPRFGTGGGTTVIGDIDIDCGGPTAIGADIDCGVVM